MGAHVTPLAPAVAGEGKPWTARLDSVDLLRGVVIVIMALDHVRDFFSERLFQDPTDLAVTTEGIFLTRWITHYCAPTFIFLAGTGAFLSGTRGKSRTELASFLCTRGLWLLVLELTVIRLSWMFNFDLYQHGGGVFWAIGWSMVVLSGLVFLPTEVVAAFGVAMIASHNLLDNKTAADVGLPPWLWVILHSPGDAPVVGKITFGTGYCLIPWIGVMAVGYAFGTVLRLEPGRRRRYCFAIGGALILGFVVLRAANVYGDARLWKVQSSALLTVCSFLNCTKYPPSLLYLLMTLGPAILALGLFDRPLGLAAKPFVTFGRVPLFFYLLHVPLIHGGAVLCDYLRFGWSPQATAGPWDVKPEKVPETYGVSLPVVYLLWVAVVLLLYPACRWFAEVKRRHRAGWLSYL